MERLYGRRVEKSRERAAEAGAGALLVTHPANLLYLCGFTGSAGALLVEAGQVTLFTDGRYSLQSREEVHGAKVRISSGAWLGAVGKHLRRKRGAVVAFDPGRLTVAQKNELQRAAGKGIRWLGLANVVEELRAVKDAEEIERMRRAARLGCEVFAEVLPLVRPGVREMELAAEIEYRMKRKGASGAAFETIVASGARAALPHARATQRRLGKNELVVFDLGAILAHYCCDLTRTVHVGRAPARVRRWYEAVRGAQGAAQAALRAGVPAAAVDAAARRVLRRFRLDHYFVHSTGHGLGLEVHEEPRLASGQKKVVQAGNVVTLEPGVYVAGVGGIRIEDDVAVFADHTEVLTDAPHDLLEL